MEGKESIMDIRIIQDLCSKKALRWTNHIFVRLAQRSISMQDVLNVIMNGEIIEEYLEDYPYPSCLIIGYSVEDKIIHIVCGIGEGEVWLITAYYPEKEKWSEDFKIRKES